METTVGATLFQKTRTGRLPPRLPPFVAVLALSKGPKVPGYPQVYVRLGHYTTGSMPCNTFRSYYQIPIVFSFSM